MPPSPGAVISPSPDEGDKVFEMRSCVSFQCLIEDGERALAPFLLNKFIITAFLASLLANWRTVDWRVGP